MNDYYVLEMVKISKGVLTPKNIMDAQTKIESNGYQIIDAVPNVSLTKDSASIIFKCSKIIAETTTVPKKSASVKIERKPLSKNSY